MEFLAHRISSNVRVLEGALNRLFAYASLVGREINLDMAQECLADILRASERKVTIDEIIRKVADHYNLRMSDLLSARRARQVARPRQVAMYLAKTLTSRSLPDIGRRFGGRDHTTVIHAVRKIEELQRQRQPDRRGRRAAAADARGLTEAGGSAAPRGADLPGDVGDQRREHDAAAGERAGGRDLVEEDPDPERAEHGLERRRAAPPPPRAPAGRR